MKSRHDQPRLTFRQGGAIRGVAVGLLGITVAVAAAALAVSKGSSAAAAAQYGPRNTAPPTVSGTPQEGQTLTASPGSWVGSGLKFTYQWRRCNAQGGSCSDISAATGRTYKLQGVDVGDALRVRVTATDPSGSAASASSAPTAVISGLPKPSPTGCPGGSGTARVDQITTPARLLIDHFQVTPSPVGGSTQSIVGRFHVADTCGQSVQGAIVYVTGVPFDQFSVPPEQPTGADGWVSLQMNRQAGYPATKRQQLLVFMVRARKAGEPLLAGISTRRLISVPVNLAL